MRGRVSCAFAYTLLAVIGVVGAVPALPNIGRSAAFGCDASHAFIVGEGGRCEEVQGGTVCIGYRQKSKNDQDPIVVRFDKDGTQTVCNTNIDTSPADSKGQGIIYNPHTKRLYGIFTVDGGSNDAGSFSRFTKSGWMSGYGSGGGPKSLVVLELHPTTLEGIQGTYLNAVLSSGKTNTVSSVESFGFGGDKKDHLVMGLSSAWSPRFPDKSLMECQNLYDGEGWNWEVVFSPDLKEMVYSTSEACQHDAAEKWKVHKRPSTYPVASAMFDWEHHVITASCPTGWTQVGAWCFVYKGFGSDVNQAQAEQACVAEGATLADAHDYDEAKGTIDLLVASGKNQAWIEGKRDTKGEWHAYDGHKLTYPTADPGAEKYANGYEAFPLRCDWKGCPRGFQGDRTTEMCRVMTYWSGDAGWLDAECGNVKPAALCMKKATVGGNKSGAAADEAERTEGAASGDRFGLGIAVGASIVAAVGIVAGIAVVVVMRRRSRAAATGTPGRQQLVLDDEVTESL